MGSKEAAEHEAISLAQGLVIHHLVHEINLMREILANMHEEQQAILNRNEEVMPQIMRRRDDFYTKLSHVRTNRMSAVESLAILLIGHKDGELLFKEKKGLDVLLSAKGVESCQILSLRDQMVALVEKMNQQICRNNDLIKHHISYFPEGILRYHPEVVVKPSQKMVLTDDSHTA